jgi:hypothetical protein
LRGLLRVELESERIDDTRRVWLEQSGTAIEGLLSDERGLASQVFGTVQDNGHFELARAGQRSPILRGEIQAGVLGALWLFVTPLNESEGPKSPAGFRLARRQPFALPADPAAIAARDAAAHYQGFIGERAVLLRLIQADGGFAGELRFGNGESHALHGVLTSGGVLRLEERQAEAVLGVLELLVAAERPAELAWAAALGTETLANGKSAFVALERNQWFEIETKDVGAGQRVEPHFALYWGDSCAFRHEWPVVLGSGKAELNRKLAALSMVGIETPICDAPYSSLATRPFVTERSYQTASLGGGRFGVHFMQVVDGNGAHELVSDSCYLVDASSARVLDLGQMLSAAEPLSRLVTAKLLREAHVRSLQQLRDPNAAANPSDREELVPITQAAFCPVAAGIEVRFDPYVLGPWALGAPTTTLTRAEARPHFARDASLDAHLR